jgi:acetyl-CoA carboxylase biotin carboxylase subunit
MASTAATSSDQLGFPDNRLRRVLIANRGEIAVRIAKACFDEGIPSVAAYSEVDASTMAARLADSSVQIGPADATRSYLNIGAVVCAALMTDCDAIHPGYGFLAERPELAEACAANGLVFVGPSADTIRRGGDKIASRELATSLGIPVTEGSAKIGSAEDAVEAAEGNYPILLKAAAGGGGKGMLLVHSRDELGDAFSRTSREAQSAFGDGRVYVERYVENARHVEVQVLADSHGNVVHLGDRDCSCQRRHQKLIEEAPAFDLEPAMRADLADAATTLARELRYVGAGTVEFLIDRDRGTFSFLEINTRVQVEHPVTEEVTGIDIVREQLRIAAGTPLSFRQSDVTISGHAIEARINAETPESGFIPSPGLLTQWLPPHGAAVRVDSHCYTGYTVPPHYDSLLAKVITRGSDRQDAINTLRRALDHFEVTGVDTTIGLHRAVLADRDFTERRHTTRWFENTFLPTWLEGL